VFAVKLDVLTYFAPLCIFKNFFKNSCIITQYSMVKMVERSSVCLPVRPSVCPIDREQQRRAAGLLLSAPRMGDID